MKRTVKEIRDAVAELNEKFEGLEARLDSEGQDKMKAEELAEMRSYPSTLKKLNEEMEIAMAVEARAIDKAARLGNVNPGVGNTSISDKEVRDFSQARVGVALADLSQYGELRGIEAEVDVWAREDAAQRGFGDLGTGFAMPAEVGKVERRGQTVTGQTTNPGDQGGVLVPTEINQFIAALWDESIAGQVNATRFTNLVGDQAFPVQLTKPTGQDLTEIQEGTEEEILWGEITMKPDRRFTSIPISARLLRQSRNSLDIAGFVSGQMSNVLAYKLDVEIKNLLMALTSPQLVSLGTNGAALDWAAIVALETKIKKANAKKGQIKYLTNASVVGAMKTTKKDAGSGIFLMEGGQTNGYDVVESEIMPSNLTKGSASAICSSLVLGNFRDLYIGMWGGIVFETERKPAKDQTVIYANAHWNTKIARAASFALYKDVLA